MRWNGQLAELSSVGRITCSLDGAYSTFDKTRNLFHLDMQNFSVSDGFASIDQLQWTPKGWKTQGHFSGIALLPGEHQELKTTLFTFGW